MNRLFGAKNNAPKPTLSSAIGGIETRVESIDVKLAKLNTELSGYQKRLSTMRDGPGKNAVKQKALKVLQQRKMWESQRDKLQNQSWSMEQATMMQDNLKNTMATVDAMKTTTKELRKQYGNIKIDKIEKMRDEMEDLMEQNEELQNVFSSYDVPEDVDEEELDAELAALEDDMEFEGGLESETPGFLTDEVKAPDFIDEAPTAAKTKEAAT